MKASEAIDRFGWTRDGFGVNASGHELLPSELREHARVDELKGLCVSGAIIYSCGIEEEEEIDRQMRVLAAHLGIPSHHIGKWNDAEGRTEEDVLNALEAAGL